MRWTKEEEARLIELSLDRNNSINFIANKLNRTDNSIRRKIQSLKIKRARQDIWSPEEDLILLNQYPSLGAAGLSSILKRSREAISSRAYSKGIIFISENSWSDNEINWLINNYQKTGAEIASSFLNKSIKSIYAKAHKLGIEGKASYGYSPISIKWLNSFNNSNILHAENGGEQRVLNYRVDGYDPTTNTVYEFHGDVFHGNLDLFSPTSTPHPYNKDITAEELWQKTFDRMLKLSKVSNVIYIWENDYKLGKESERF